MSDPAHASTPAPPLGTTVLDGGSGPTPASVLGWVRTLLAAVLGAVAAVFLAAALVVAMSVQHAFDEEHPWASVGVLLTVPQVRAELTSDLVDDVTDLSGTTLSPAQRAETQQALDDVLGSPEIRDAFGDLTVVDGEIDGNAFVDVAVRELDERATGASPEVRAALEAYATRIDTVAEREGAVGRVEDGARTIEQLRRFGYGAAGVLLVPAVVCWLLAVGVARRRGLTAALVVSGGLLLASMLLAPGTFVLDHLPGPLEVPGLVLATLGSMVGAGWVWSLVVWALVPPAVWVVLRVVRSGRGRDEGAGPLWVP